MKQSRIKRLIPKKLARQMATAHGGSAPTLSEFMKHRGAATIAKMRAKGYELVTCLDTGEGIFVREEDVVGLHIQLPSKLYRKLDAVCRQTGQTKRSVVVEALERHLDTGITADARSEKAS